MLEAFRLLAPLALGIILAPATSRAENGHQHLASARKDLRRAQALLRVADEPEIARNLKVADDKIELAISELDRAAILDRQDLDDHPTVDVGMAREERFVKIGELLRSALVEIKNEEGRPGEDRWRTSVLRLVSEAQHAFFLASYDAGYEPRLEF